MDEIFQILRECDLYDKSGETLDTAESNFARSTKRNIEMLFAQIQSNIGSVEYANLNKMLALCYLKVIALVRYRHKIT